MVKRPRPRTPGSVSHTSFLLALALLVAASVSRAVITPARAPAFRVVRSAVAAAVSVAVSVVVLEVGAKLAGELRGQRRQQNGQGGQSLLPVDDLPRRLAFFLDEHDAAQELGVVLLLGEEVDQDGEQLSRLHLRPSVRPLVGRDGVVKVGAENLGERKLGSADLLGPANSLALLSATIVQSW